MPQGHPAFDKPRCLVRQTERSWGRTGEPGVLRIAFVDPAQHDYTVDTPFEQPFGGSQSALCYLAIELAALGHDVACVTHTSRPRLTRGVHCVGQRPGLEKPFLDGFDVVVILNAAVGIDFRQVLRPDIALALWTQHAGNQPAVKKLAVPAERQSWTGFAFVSAWQLEDYRRRYGLPAGRTTILRNAMSPAFATLPPREDSAPAAAPLFAYTSTPYRGLDLLLDAWPAIQAGLPGAGLKVFSSMSVYQVKGPEDAYSALYERCRAMPGVEYIGSIAQPGLAAALHQVDALTYPSIFAETSCIAAIEALAAGCLLLATDLGALKETANGFARLVPLQADRALLVESFAAMVVTEWRAAVANPATHRARIEAQADFFRRNAVWPARAHEWAAWLESLVTPKSEGGGRWASP